MPDVGPVSTIPEIGNQKTIACLSGRLRSEPLFVEKEVVSKKAEKYLPDDEQEKNSEHWRFQTCEIVGAIKKSSDDMVKVIRENTRKKEHS